MDNVNQLERVRYWQGQLLASSDLRTQMSAVAELRRLHNRDVHSAYGIAIGLTAGDIKNGALPLTCGLAYDCSGRELMVPVDRQVPLPVPAITKPYLLTIGYNAALGDSTLEWRPQSMPVASDNVALARLIPGAPDPQLDPDFRPVVARPLARPQIASGQTVPGDTAWESWDESGVSLGVQSDIDTSAAGFTSTPNYFAEAVTDNPTADFVPAWFTSVADPAPDSFTLRLFMRRITRESFDILDPKTQVAKTPTGGKVSLVSGNVFVQGDIVSRVLPIAESVSVVKALSGTTATLDTPLAAFSATKQVAFGNPPRLATVTKAPAAANGFAVTVDNPAAFQATNVVAKMGPHFATARPTTVTSIDDAGELQLANPITGLAPGDQLGIAQTASAVTAVTTTTVTVQNPALFSLNDIVVCVDTPESFNPAKVTGIAGNSNEILTLTPMIAGVNGLHIASVQLGGTVQTVDTEASEVQIQVDQPKLFRAGDLVAKVLPGGVYSELVRVQSVQSGKSLLTLAKPIAGLALNDEIGSADYRIRSTVLAVSSGGATVNVANASLFPTNSSIVQLNDSYVAVASASVTNSTGATLSVSPSMSTLVTGSIIALCSLPVSVTVESIDQNGIVQVDTPDLVKAGDVVGAVPDHPVTAIVAASSGTSIRLATPIPGLAAGDVLSVLTIGGTVNVTPVTTTTSKVTLDPDNRIRVGDVLADIAGWREPGPVRSISLVADATGTDLTLFSPIDGLIVNDNIGLASLAGAGGPLIRLRIKTVPTDLTPGDEALVVGLDRLQGQTSSVFAIVEAINKAVNIVVLFVEGTPKAFTIRPEDLSASILFTRGSPLALVQNQNLYVSWLACQNPDPMPRPCPDPATPDCPCGNATQS